MVSDTELKILKEKLKQDIDHIFELISEAEYSGSEVRPEHNGFDKAIYTVNIEPLIEEVRKQFDLVKEEESYVDKTKLDIIEFYLANKHEINGEDYGTFSS